jgi:hypothetical protein
MILAYIGAMFLVPLLVVTWDYFDYKAVQNYGILGDTSELIGWMIVILIVGTLWLITGGDPLMMTILGVCSLILGFGVVHPLCCAVMRRIEAGPTQDAESKEE